MTTWGDIAADIAGTKLVRHAALTCCGTWGTPGVGFQSDVINGLNQYVSPDLAYEVPVLYPGAFGPITGGNIAAPSYQQSIDQGVEWAGNWITDNPTKTFLVGGYSQGAELAARIAIEVTTGSLTAYKENFIGGYTFGPPSRGQGLIAPTCPDPGGSGISSVNMTIANVPIVNGQQCWADYCEKGDMYGSTPNLLPDGKTLSEVGVMMRQVYTMATEAQLNDIAALTKSEIAGLITAFEDLGGFKALGITPLLPSSLAGLAGNLLALLAVAGVPFLLGLFTDLISPSLEYTSTATGVQAAGIACAVGLQFLASGAAPHGWYEGGGGPRNYVGDAVGFLANICTLTPARA